jgi:hypothetical protein
MMTRGVLAWRGVKGEVVIDIHKFIENPNRLSSSTTSQIRF